MALRAAAYYRLEHEKNNKKKIFAFIILKPLCRSILIALLAVATARTPETSRRAASVGSPREGPRSVQGRAATTAVHPLRAGWGSGPDSPSGLTYIGHLMKRNRGQVKEIQFLTVCFRDIKTQTK